MLLLHYLCVVVHAPPGEEEHYSFIRSNEAESCLSKKSQLNCSKKFIIAQIMKSFSSDSSACGCVCVCMLYYSKLIKAADSSVPFAE